MKPIQVRYAALCLTHNCNLRCKYCYSGPKSDNRMTSEIARQAIDFLHRVSKGKCTVTFFGGEPLLEFALIREIVDYSRDRYGTDIAFRMSTNGTMLTPEILEYLNQKEIFFVLSLDGCQEQHDASRVYADGRGSYRSATRELEKILELNPYTLAVSVIVPETTGYLAEGVRSLYAAGFRYVVQTLDYSANWSDHDLWALKRQYRLLAVDYYQRLMAGEKIYYSPFDERIKTWAQKPYANGDLCDLANSQIAIAPSGRIYPCVQFVSSDSGDSEENTIGDVVGGFDSKRRDWFIDENYREKETCRDCALAGRCATYCGCVNWRATGHLDQIPPIICSHERMLMPIVDKMANRLWNRGSSLFKRKFYERSYPVSSYIEDCQIRRGQHAGNSHG